jgi:hypothetical protein
LSIVPKLPRGVHGPSLPPLRLDALTHKQLVAKVVALHSHPPEGYVEHFEELLTPLGPHVMPAQLWRSLKSPWTSRKASDLTYKMAHKGLYVGGRLAHAAGKPDLRRCFGCDEPNQTHEHLFVDCPTVQPFWGYLLGFADRLWPGALPRYPLSWPAMLLGFPLASYHSKYHEQMWHGMVGELKLAIYYAFQARAQDSVPFTLLSISKGVGYRLTAFIQVQQLHATQNKKHQELFAATWLTSDVVVPVPGGKCIVNT